MFEVEARWLGTALMSCGASSLSPMVNLGSSTLEFRRSVQPYIQTEIFDPLERSGVRVVHSDIRSAPGVDLVADILTDSGYSALREIQPRSLICSNLLEHVTDPGQVARRCLDVLVPGAVLAVTVPESYPYHSDPVDTMFRPTPTELAALFPGTRVLNSASVEAGAYFEALKLVPARILADLVEAAKAIRRGHAKQIHPMWLRRQYTVACVILQKE